MEPYLFHGVVLPERAQLTLRFSLSFSHLGSGANGKARVSIILNQAAVWIHTEQDWDIFALRNAVKSIVQSQLAMVGFLKGYAYDFEITRALSHSRGVDQVFGIDMPCLAGRVEDEHLGSTLAELRAKTTGRHGVLLQRCFNDLVSAMKNADDTAFYCYRAIESLCRHCAATNGQSDTARKEQWANFRSVAGCEEETLRAVKIAADPLRHGDVG